MYNKIFTKILDSSIWLEQAHVRLVWITMIAMQDKDGLVSLSGVGNVAQRARVSDQEAADAIHILESPDTRNPGQEHEGRRLERIPGTGWVVINSKKYRDIVFAEEARRLNRERVQRYREKAKTITGGCNADVMQAVALPLALAKQHCPNLQKPQEADHETTNGAHHQNRRRLRRIHKGNTTK